VISILPVYGLPEIAAGDELGAMISAAIQVVDGDVVVVAQKAVSKAEGRVLRLAEIEPSDEARRRAGDSSDPRKLEAILRETKRVVRSRNALVIAETRHGFVCASAGVDQSNAPEAGMLVLLPLDADASARRIRDEIRERSGADVAVVVSDSFGRPFRRGTTDVAIGVAGLAPLLDLRGSADRAGYVLSSSQVALADELAGAADLARGKADGVPAVVIRGAAISGDGSAAELVIPAERDLFR